MLFANLGFSLLTLVIPSSSISVLEARYNEVNVDQAYWNISFNEIMKSKIECVSWCFSLKEECDAIRYDQDLNTCQLGLILEGTEPSSESILVVQKASSSLIVATNSFSTTIVSSTTENITTTTTANSTSSLTTTTTTTTTTTSSSTISTIFQHCNNKEVKVGNQVFILANKTATVTQDDAKTLCNEMSCQLPSLKTLAEKNAAKTAFEDHSNTASAYGFWLDLYNSPATQCLQSACNYLKWDTDQENLDVDLFQDVFMNEIPTQTCVRINAISDNVVSTVCTEKYGAVCMCSC